MTPGGSRDAGGFRRRKGRIDSQYRGYWQCFGYTSARHRSIIGLVVVFIQRLPQAVSIACGFVLVGCLSGPI
jgi:hypothetical protein